MKYGTYLAHVKHNTSAASCGFFHFSWGFMDNTVLYVGGAVASGIGAFSFWLFRSLVGRVDANEKELAAFKLHCAETYVTSSALEKAIDRFSESINAVFKKLERIDQKLDGKADKQ